MSLSFAVGMIALLYSSVGHAGASGYIAVMTLWGIAPTVIRPTALVLNILVACIGAFQFWRAGPFLVETLLAVCAAFHSGRLSWWVFATVRFGLENFNWARASLTHSTSLRAGSRSPRRFG